MHLIDTPGFDDTYRKDIDVLKDITFWLSKAYEDNISLTGIIYLHRITDTRMGGVALKDLNMFKKLCGEESFSSVALVTTFWEDVVLRAGEARERELMLTPEFYGTMLRAGSKMKRHTNNRESAMAIIADLVDRGTTTVLNIQHELGAGKQLDETAAGVELEKDMLEQRAEFSKRLEDSTRAMEEAIKTNNAQRAAELAAEQDELNQKIQAAERSREEMRIDMERLFHEKESQFRQTMQELEAEREERQKMVMDRAKEIQDWQKALNDAEKLFEQRQKEQEDEVRRMREESHRVQESLAQAREYERKNKEMEANLARAREEEDKRRIELHEAQVAMARMVASQSQRPEHYRGNPPSYDSVLHAQNSAEKFDRRLDNAATISSGVAIASVALMACTIM